VEYLYSQFHLAKEFNIMNVASLNALNPLNNLEALNLVQTPANRPEVAENNHPSNENFQEKHVGVQAQPSQANLNFSNFSELYNISPTSCVNNNNFSLNSSIFNDCQNQKNENNLISSSKQPVFTSIKKAKKALEREKKQKSSNQDNTQLGDPYAKNYKNKKTTSSTKFTHNNAESENNKKSNFNKNKNFNFINSNRFLNSPETCQNMNINNLNMNFPMNFNDYNSLIDFNNLGTFANFNQSNNNFYNSHLPMNMINNSHKFLPNHNINKEASQIEEAFIPFNISLQEKKKIEKNDYLDLLIFAAESLLEKGLLSKEDLKSGGPELHTITEMQSHSSSENNFIKMNSNQTLKTNEDKETLHFRDCDNKVCLIRAPKNSDIWVRTKLEKGKWAHFCITCNEAWKSGQFCFYCAVIYADNAGNHYNDTKNWVMCDYCEMWQHIQCEEQSGYYPNLSSLLEDSEFKYMCPLCRKKTGNNQEFNDSTAANSNNSVFSPEVKTKRKYKFKKPHGNSSGIFSNQRKEKNSVTSYEKDFLGHKLANENYEYQSGKFFFKN
jgi:hypothetical protein